MAPDEIHPDHRDDAGGVHDRRGAKPTMKELEPSERIFQAQVMQIAASYGWRVAHFRPSQTKDGRWLTAMSGDAGYPDLTLAHPTKGVLFAELKTSRGRTSLDQELWLKFLQTGASVGTAVALWRPADLDNIARLLFEGVHRSPRNGEAGRAP